LYRVFLVETKEKEYEGESRRRQSEEEEARGGTARSLEMVGTLKVSCVHMNASFPDFYFTLAIFAD